MGILTDNRILQETGWIADTKWQKRWLHHKLSTKDSKVVCQYALLTVSPSKHGPKTSTFFLVRVFGASEIKRIHKHQKLQNAIYTCLKMKHHTDTHVPLGTGTSISCPFAAQGTGLTKRPMTPPTWTKTRMIPCDKLDTQLSEVCRGKKKQEIPSLQILLTCF